MSLPWKLMPLAAIFVALGALLLTPGGVTQPYSASADQDCSEDDGTSIEVLIIDADTGDPLEVAGSVIEIDPDPFDDDGLGSPEFTDNGADDSDDDNGVILLEDVCGDDDGATHATFDVELISLPAIAEDCDIDVEAVSDTEFPLDGDSVTVELEVDCSDEDLTPPTATVGPAATVIANASPNAVNCGGTSIVTIQVRSANGNPVAVGTAVQIAASIGSVSPNSGQTTDASGSAFVFYTAPGNAGGAATITATAGSASGQTTVNVNCAGATPTTAPPPTVSPGTISPPNTGDAGLVQGNSSSWHFAGLLTLVAGLSIGAIAMARVRA